MRTDKLKQIASHTIIRYLVIGGFSYSIELGLLISLIRWGHISRLLSTAIAFWLGLVVAFVLQKLLAFQDYRREKRLLQKQGLMYGILVVFNCGFTLLVVGFFLKDQAVVVSRSLALLTTTVWNFFIYKHVIFKPGAQDLDQNGRSRS